MLAEVTGMQFYCLHRSGGSPSAGQLSDSAGLAKLNNTTKARVICAEARDLLGGNGILLENHVIRHIGRHRGDPHLRGDGDDADLDRRAGHHRGGRVRLMRQDP